MFQCFLWRWVYSWFLCFLWPWFSDVRAFRGRRRRRRRGTRRGRLRGCGRRQGHADRAHQGRRPQDPDQRRRTMQRAAVGARRPSDSSPTRRRTCCARCCDRGRCTNSARSSKNDLGIPLALEEESGKLFPAIEPRARRARCVGAVCRSRTASSLQFGTTVTNLSRSRGGFTLDTSSGALECVARRPGDRRPLGAGDRQRRHRAPHRADARSRPRSIPIRRSRRCLPTRTVTRRSPASR